MYQRKTRDEYWIEQNWGYGWDKVCCEKTRKEALKTYKEYIENQPVPTRIKKYRVPKKEVN